MKIKKTENMKEYMKEYRKKNMEKWNGYKTCPDCDCIYKICGKTMHMKSKKHEHLILKKKLNSLKNNINDIKI